MKRLLLTAFLTGSGTLSATAQERPPDDIPRTRPDFSLIDPHAGARPRLGVTVSRNESGGLTVEEVIEGSPAEYAGVQKGDVLLKINGVALRSVEGLRMEVQNSEPDTAVSLEWRRGEQRMKAGAFLRTESRRSPVDRGMIEIQKAVERLNEQGVPPPRGLLRELRPGNPAGRQMEKLAPEVPKAPLEDESEEILPQLEFKLEPQWKDGELQFKLRESEKAPPEQPRMEAIEPPDPPLLSQTEDAIWRKVHAAVARALEEAGLPQEVREKAGQAIRNARQERYRREARRAEILRETRELEQQIRQLREKSKRLQREANELSE